MEAFVLIQAHPGIDLGSLAEDIAQVRGVVKADPVRGAYDVIAKVTGEAHPVAHAIGGLDGVLRAITVSKAA